MLPFKYLKTLWRDAYAARDHTKMWTTAKITADGLTEPYVIPNLGDDIVAVVLHMSVKLDAAAAEAVIAGKKICDLLDNTLINDPSGKTVHNISKAAIFNFVCEFMDKNFTYDALTDFAGAGSSTFTATIPIPVYIPASDGLHTIQFDIAVGNMYAADVTLNAASYIRLEVVTKNESGLEKFKAISQAVAIPVGPFSLTTLETGRVWYTIGVFGGLAALTDLDDIKLGVDNDSLVVSKYKNIHDTWLDAIRYTPRTAYDAFMYFRPHLHKNTDTFDIEGAVAKTPEIFVIASADVPSVTATVAPAATVTVSAMSGARQAAQVSTAQVQGYTPRQFKAVPVKI